MPQCSTLPSAWIAWSAFPRRLPLTLVAPTIFAIVLVIVTLCTHTTRDGALVTTVVVNQVIEVIDAVQDASGVRTHVAVRPGGLSCCGHSVWYRNVCAAPHTHTRCGAVCLIVVVAHMGRASVSACLATTCSGNTRCFRLDVRVWIRNQVSLESIDPCPGREEAHGAMMLCVQGFTPPTRTRTSV